MMTVEIAAEDGTHYSAVLDTLPRVGDRLVFPTGEPAQKGYTVTQIVFQMTFDVGTQATVSMINMSVA